MTTVTKWMMAFAIALLVAVTLWGGSILSTALAQRGDGAYVDSQPVTVDNATGDAVSAPAASHPMGPGGWMMQGRSMAPMQASDRMTETAPYGSAREDWEYGWGMRHGMEPGWSEAPATESYDSAREGWEYGWGMRHWMGPWWGEESAAGE